MNHDYIEEHQIRELYLTRRLSDDDRARFESHFVGCQECLDQLEATESFIKGMKAVVADDVMTSYGRAGVVARVDQSLVKTRAWQALFAAAGLILFALPILI